MGGNFSHQLTESGEALSVGSRRSPGCKHIRSENTSGISNFHHFSI